MQEASDKKRVAIACQVGGSHTAFTAGVIKGLLRSGRPRSNELVGLSGTSGRVGRRHLSPRDKEVVGYYDPGLRYRKPDERPSAPATPGQGIKFAER